MRSLRARLPGLAGRAADRPPPEDDEKVTGALAVYARVLDGDSLWLAVTGTTAPVGLRRAGSDEIVVPDSDAPPDPAATSLRWHLPTVLPEPIGARSTDEGEVFEIVTVPDGSPVHAATWPDPAPMRTPPSRDGRWRFDVRRQDTGAVVVRRDARPPVAEVIDVGVDHRGVVLAFTDPGLTAPQLLLMDADGAPVAELPVDVDAGRLTASVGADAVPAEVGPHWFLGLADGDRRIPLVRSRNDSRMPGHSTVLPLLWSGEGEDRSMVRVQWQREGRVRVNRPPMGSSPVPAGDVDEDA